MRVLHQIASDYRVTVNGNYGSRPSDKARIQVSIGNQKYESAKFLTLTEWCNSRFQEVEVIVSDTLQRHNYIYDTPSAWNLSREEGDKWIRRNSVALDGLKITRWDSLLQNEAYLSSLKIIEQSLVNPSVSKSLQDMAEQFANRRGIPVKNSINFLKEELAVFNFMMREPAVDIYAGTWISNLFEVLNLPVFKDIHCLEVDFERLKKNRSN